MKTFRFDLEETVSIECSGETGVVIGRAQYLGDDDQYYIRYKAADGRAVTQWWPEPALVNP